MAATAVLGLATTAPATTATLTLNPTHEVASAAGNYFDATFYVDTCFTGVTAKILWQGPATIVAVANPPCSGQTMTVFFSHVPGPGPAPGYSTWTAGLFANSDTRNLQPYASAQAVFRMDAPPAPPTVNPNANPPAHVGPPAGPPAPAVTAPSPSIASPSATPCPLLTAAVIRSRANPDDRKPFGLIALCVLLVAGVLLLRMVRHKSAAALLVVTLVGLMAMSCGRYPLNAVSEGSSPAASQPTPSASPFC